MMNSTQSTTSKNRNDSFEKMNILAAQGLITSWLKGESITQILNRPYNEEFIIEVAKEIKDPELQKKWLRKVRGNNHDLRRLNLAQKCAEAIKQRYK